MRESFKRLAEFVPYPLGRLLSSLPMVFRLGFRYVLFSKRVVNEESIAFAEQLNEIRGIVEFAYDKTEFYRNLYDSNGVDVRSLYSLEDFKSLPIVDKAQLRSAGLKTRSTAHGALKKSNTGGTSGQPLDFFIEKDAYAREWAHMHAIWATIGYKVGDEKITIRGKNIGQGFYKYSFNQNEFLINAYVPIKENLDSLRFLLEKRSIKWIHGYPSAIYSFLNELEFASPELFQFLKERIKGVFLGSEFPSPIYRRYIDEYCGFTSISWYGHSEMAVLAAERCPGSGEYFPFKSYGFAEAVPDGECYRLVVTSLFNNASPFIRYDTGDLIEPKINNGLLESFKIKEGRNSDSVEDKNGRLISLTALIFGRHHEAFDYCDHIQVRQLELGVIEVLITSRETGRKWSELFDFSNCYFEVKYTQIEIPIRSRQGKVPLLLR